MYMRPRCTEMSRHLLLLTFVELKASKYSMIFCFTIYELSDLLLLFVNILLYSHCHRVPSHHARSAGKTLYVLLMMQHFLPGAGSPGDVFLRTQS